jgi:hypothetical protein
VSNLDDTDHVVCCSELLLFKQTPPFYGLRGFVLLICTINNVDCFESEALSYSIHFDPTMMVDIEQERSSTAAHPKSMRWMELYEMRQEFQQCAVGMSMCLGTAYVRALVVDKLSCSGKVKSPMGSITTY